MYNKSWNISVSLHLLCFFSQSAQGFHFKALFSKYFYACFAYNEIEILSSLYGH